MFDQQIALAKQNLIKTATEHIQKNTVLSVHVDDNCSSDEKTSVTHQSNAQELILIIDIAGYGSMEKRWKAWLIGTGVGEGVVQGAVVYSATHNLWLGTGVLAEECVSEYLSWNGVDWFLGEAYAPVTLEGKLINDLNQQVIWKDTAFISENNDALKTNDKSVKITKEQRLLASLEKAQNELFDSLNDYLKKVLIMQH